MTVGNSDRGSAQDSADTRPEGFRERTQQYLVTSGLDPKRALVGKSGTTPVRYGMAHDPGSVPVFGKILSSLAAGTAVMLNGRSQIARPSPIAAKPHGGNEPFLTNTAKTRNDWFVVNAGYSRRSLQANCW